MESVYQSCPRFENDIYLLRLVETGDCADLLRVYSDVKAVPLFNSDNCGGDDFYYTTPQRMSEAIDYWLWEYSRGGFVRWSILDKHCKAVIGTIELFHRDADDYFTNCGLLRLDLRSDYESSKQIEQILSLILGPAFELFQCNMIATKAIREAEERKSALKNLVFHQSKEPLIGHDSAVYTSYFVRRK